MSESTLIKTGIIYMIEHNTLSNYRYIGLTTKNIKSIWATHKQTVKKYDKMFYRLSFFINYYDGIENFNIREYKTYNNITKIELDEEEKKYINELGTLNSRNANELITINITNDMRNELIKKFIDKKIDIVDLYKLIDTFNYTHYKRERTDFILDDINENLLTELLKTTLLNNLINTKVITDIKIDDYIKYIKFFNKEYEITNNKDDIYNYTDLINCLKTYDEHNKPFDNYLLNDFENILQHYFNILNNAFTNVDINYQNNVTYGITKISSNIK